MSRVNETKAFLAFGLVFKALSMHRIMNYEAFSVLLGLGKMKLHFRKNEVDVHLRVLYLYAILFQRLACCEEIKQIPSINHTKALLTSEEILKGVKIP